MGLFDRLFSDETDMLVQDAIDAANAEILFSQHPVYALFLRWLDDQIDRSVAPGEQLRMIAEVSKIAAFREVRDHLRRRTADAARLLDRAREERHGS